MTLALGSRGPEVIAWQRALAGRGYAVGVPDSVFGKLTHNATLAFQASVGLPTTGKVGGPEQMALIAGTKSARPLPVLAHTIPFVEAKFYNRSARSVVDLIVLHCMECPEASTGAESCAHYLATLPDDTPSSGKKSDHYNIDSDTVVQSVPDHCIAYGAPGANANGLHFEHAGYARQTREQWLDDFGQRMLDLSAQLAARKCREWDIPITFLRAADLQRPRPRGITTHYEVSTAFKKSDHTDPGKEFPMSWYLSRVQLAYDAATARV